MLLDKESMKKVLNETLLQSQIEIREQTIQHIGQELHNNLGQVASLIKMNLNTLNLSNPENASEKIENTLALTRQLIADIKLLSVTLGAASIEQTGLAQALETDIRRISKSGQFRINYQVKGILPEIDRGIAIILYRMTQEVFNNTVKHSKAKQINVLLSVSEKSFTLVFTDDGIGFNKEEKMNSGGAGLRSLQNRARLINAQLNIQSTPGNGTDITIALPI